MKNRKGVPLMLAGLLLIVAALLLVLYNTWESNTAGDASEDALMALESLRFERKMESPLGTETPEPILTDAATSAPTATAALADATATATSIPTATAALADATATATSAPTATAALPDATATATSAPTATAALPDATATATSAPTATAALPDATATTAPTDAADTATTIPPATAVPTDASDTASPASAAPAGTATSAPTVSPTAMPAATATHVPTAMPAATMGRYPVVKGTTPVPAQTPTATPTTEPTPTAEPVLTPEPLPIWERVPGYEMPVVEIGGLDYVGTLTIPALGLKLPVQQTWSYKLLKTSPCVFHNTCYEDGFVIIAHRYNTHFAGLKDLRPGDKATFTDMDGNVFRYEVVTTDTLMPNQLEELLDEQYAMSLMTCTYDGSKRVTVRFRRR